MVIQIRTYDIYQGIAAEGSLVAAAVFSLEDFKEMGRSLDEYKDYLLERQNCLDVISCRPVRIVHVPFDKETYKNWLKKKPYWAKKRESYSAWALDVAKNPKVLSALLEKHPVMPSPPVEEETGILTLYGIIPVFIENKNEIQLMAESLPHGTLSRIAANVRSVFAVVPDFKPLSPFRSRGIRLYVGDRFIPPFKAEEFERIFCDVNRILRYPDNIVPVPAKCKIQPEGVGQKEMLMLSVLLPVIIVGASADLDYCERLLDELRWEVEPAAEVMREYVAGTLKNHVPDAYVLFAQLPDIWNCIDDIMSDSEMVMPKVKNKNSNSNIKRIK
ncbi:MAG TPA: hypothetical protein PK728_01725 [Bacillota bacterium]|nr:hypothetical protein [Bacillota bacterium]